MAHDNKNNTDVEKTKDTDHYKEQYYDDFVDKWDDLIDWDARARRGGVFY